jgi:hypothetical protein
MRYRSVGYALLILAVVPTTVRAQAETGAPALLFPRGVRGNAMGYSGVADRSDPSSIYFNPANVTAHEGVWATGSREKLVPGLADDVWFGHLNIGGGYSVGSDPPVRLGLNVTLARLSYGSSIATTPQGTPLGEYESHEDVFGVTAGAAGVMGERVHWAMGAAVRRFSAEYAPSEVTVEGTSTEGSSWITDVGAVLSTIVEASDWRVRPAVGVAGINMGSDVEFDDREQADPLPSWFNYGVSVRVDGPDVVLGSNEIPAVSGVLNLDGNHGLNDQRPHWGFGYELVLMEILFARWGRRTDDRDHTPFDTWGVALGVPVGPLRARFEYASVQPPSPLIPRDIYGFTLAWLLGDR